MINYRIDATGIATIEWDMPARTQNVLNGESLKAWFQAMDLALADAAVRGILVTSAKQDFIAGGDLEELLKLQSAEEVIEWGRAFHEACRRFETAGKPIACAMPGSSLGGGLELALVCHHRVAALNPKARFGLPEVTLGLLPGGGGTQRLARLLGCAAALPLLVQGRLLKAEAALAAGVLDAVVPQGEERAAARHWLQSAGAAQTRQPWDRPASALPGGPVMAPAAQAVFAQVRAQLAATPGLHTFAATHILSCVEEGLSGDFESGLAAESRHFAACAISPEAKQLIKKFFAARQATAAGAATP